jgi:hypothetical protein
VRWHDRNGGAVAVALAVVLSVLLDPGAGGETFLSRYLPDSQYALITDRRYSWQLASSSCERLVEFCGISASAPDFFMPILLTPLAISWSVGESARCVHLWIALTSFGDGGGVERAQVVAHYLGVLFIRCAFGAVWFAQRHLV